MGSRGKGEDFGVSPVLGSHKDDPTGNDPTGNDPTGLIPQESLWDLEFPLGSGISFGIWNQFLNLPRNLFWDLDCPLGSPQESI